jgi:predicted Abi (CAAX) family protease
VVAAEDVIVNRTPHLLAFLTRVEQYGLVGIVLVVFAAVAALVGYHHGLFSGRLVYPGILLALPQVSKGISPVLGSQLRAA